SRRTGCGDGTAMDRWNAMIAAQGGDPAAPLPVATHTETFHADADGVLSELDAYEVGIAAWRLGAGRERQGQDVQPGAGIELHVFAIASARDSRSRRSTPTLRDVSPTRSPPSAAVSASPTRPPFGSRS
ncbi:hypothetical protein NJ76_18570, partial [Rhodococcus sp. IITR03]